VATGAALGLVPHTGWAWLVRVDEGQVVARERVVACEVLEGELYHLAAERDRDREAFLSRRRAAAAAQADEALAPHLHGARAAVVLGKRMAPLPFERILASHPLIHAAEGELWRELFAEACVAHGLRVARAQADELRAQLGDREVFLAAGKRALGGPWTREIQDAALAALSARPPR
jgi:hypothetical protein